MFESTPHINHRSRRRLVLAGALLATVVVVALAATAAPSAAGSAAYGWPVKPFDREHPVRGNFGDPRTIFAAPPTAAGALTGGGEFQFHFGVDVSAPDGTAVYPVVSGAVVRRDDTLREVTVACADGRAFEYWHVVAVVHVGDRVTASRTVLGRIVRGAKHVHLTELGHGVQVNPLQAGHLTPYTHTTAPRILSIEVGGSAGVLALPNFLRGRVELVARIEDTPNRAVPGAWQGMPVAPALVTWRIALPHGRTLIGPATAVDFRTHIPGKGSFWQVYARGSFQNMSVFGEHYSFMQPGRYLYRLAHGPFDTTRLQDGVYDLVVTASDIRGNTSTASLRITVHNRPGWSGS